MIVGIMMMMMMMITIMMIFGCYRLSEGRALLLLVASLLLHSLANLGQDQQDEELHDFSMMPTCSGTWRTTVAHSGTL